MLKIAYKLWLEWLGISCKLWDVYFRSVDKCEVETGDI